MKAKNIVASWEHIPRSVAALQKWRIAYQMHDVEGFTFREIATVLGYASYGSVGKVVSRYRRTLAAQAAAHEQTESLSA